MGKSIKWYSLENILKHNVQYYMIFGERSNGKSYAVDKYIIDKFFKEGKQFGFIKRFEEDIKGKYMSEVFNHLEDYILEEYNHRIKFYRGNWLLYEDGTEGKINDCKVFGYAFSIANVNRTKATSYPDIDTLLFEEFMSVDCSYLNDELNLFLNVVSTIARHRTNVKIFMLANAISKSSPYSTALNIRLHRIEKGDIITKEYKDKQTGLKTRFAIERSENVNVFDNKENTEKVVYNIFGNSGVGKMITSGDFETHAYNRIVDNVTFNEIGKKGNVFFNKGDIIPFILKYEDYYYKIYLKYNGKFVLGFREIEYLNLKNVSFIINGNKYIEGITNINNLACYDDDRINNIINIMVLCMKQKDFVTFTDDDGENVVNGFRISGISLI